MGFRENLRKIINSRYGGVAYKFAKDVHIPNSYLNEILSGKRRWNEDILIKIASALNIPPYQLLADEPLIPYSEMPKYEGKLNEYWEKIKIFPDAISLGPGVEISEIPPEDYVLFPKKFLPRGYTSDPDRIVAFKTQGISMKPTIMPNSYVWVDRKDVEPREGQIYVFWLEKINEVTIKRLIKISRGRYCIIDGDNRNEEDRKTEELRDFPMVIDCRQHEESDYPWPIRGRVIWVLNRFIEEPKK